MTYKEDMQRRYTSGRNSNKLIVNYVKLTRISKIAQAIYHLVNLFLSCFISHLSIQEVKRIHKKAGWVVHVSDFI